MQTQKIRRTRKNCYFTKGIYFPHLCVEKKFELTFFFENTSLSPSCANVDE